MELAEYRAAIDQIDGELLRLIQQRMRVSAGIAAYKREHDLPVLDSSREEQKLQAVRESSDPELAEYCVESFRQIMAVSRAYQNELLGRKGD